MDGDVVEDLLVSVCVLMGVCYHHHYYHVVWVDVVVLPVHTSAVVVEGEVVFLHHCDPICHHQTVQVLQFLLVYSPDMVVVVVMVIYVSWLSSCFPSLSETSIIYQNFC